MAGMKHFTKDEFACPCCGKAEMNEEFLQKLDGAREIAEIPFRINSGFRCPKHNAEVGGVPESSHLLGLAADISATTGARMFRIVAGLLAAGFTRIGIGNGFVHVDSDRTKNSPNIWKY